MIIEVQCPNCRAMMEPQWETEWRGDGQRTVEMLCPKCLHRETIYLPIERKHKHASSN